MANFLRVPRKSLAVSIVSLGILVLELVFHGMLVCAKNDTFIDVPNDSSFYIPVTYLKSKNLIQGYSGRTFRPERLVNRAEALAMILRATKAVPIVVENLSAGESVTLNDVKNLRIFKPNTEKPFNDVSKKDWFFEVVKESKRLGFIAGYDNGKYFKPNKNVNLAEVLRMLFQISGTQTDLSEKNNLPIGIKADDWYASDISYALSRTMLMQQESGNIFPPGQNLTRGELAVILYRFLQNKNDFSFGFASWYGDGLAKTKLTKGFEYKEKNLTAAHKTIPFGSIVKVTNMSNGKHTNVVINDRGPFVTGRIIDLSRSAFAALESTSAGIIMVQIEVVE